MSVVYAIFFIVFLVFFYEGFLHHEESYTRLRYCVNNAFGFAALFCFAVGYVWLAFALGNN
jgi:hypothetical protein